jgi:hypothetical protein
MTVMKSVEGSKFRTLNAAECDAVGGGRDGLISEVWGGPLFIGSIDNPIPAPPRVISLR